MTVLVWPPDLPPSEIEFFLETNVGVLESPLSRASQRIQRGGARWVCSMVFQPVGPETAARLDALLAELDGPGREIRLFDFRRPEPRDSTPGELTFGGLTFSGPLRFFGYPATGRPVTAAAHTAGATAVSTSGWPNSATVLRLGDYVQIGDTLHLVVGSDVLSSSTGTATVNIRPALRRDVASGVELMLTRPTARFRLTGNGDGRNRTGNGFFSSYSLTLVEALP